MIQFLKTKQMRLYVNLFFQNPYIEDKTTFPKSFPAQKLERRSVTINGDHVTPFDVTLINIESLHLLLSPLTSLIDIFTSKIGGLPYLKEYQENSNFSCQNINVGIT